MEKFENSITKCQSTEDLLKKPEMDPEIFKKVMLLQQMHLKRFIYNKPDSKLLDTNRKPLKFKLSPRYKSQKTYHNDGRKAKNFDDLVVKYNSIFTEELKFIGMKAKFNELFSLPKLKALAVPKKPLTPIVKKSISGKYKASKLIKDEIKPDQTIRSQSVKRITVIDIERPKKEVNIVIGAKTMLPFISNPKMPIGCLTERIINKKQPLHIKELVMEEKESKIKKMSALELLDLMIKKPPPRFKI